MANIVPLKYTAKLICIQTLLDLSGDGDRHTAQQMLRQLQTGYYTAVSCGLLRRLVDKYPGKVTNTILSALASTHLRELKLKKCKSVSFTGLKNVLETCPLITKLDLAECDQFSQPEVFHITSFLRPGITALSLENCLTVDNAVVQSILLYMKSLQHLNLSGCSKLTDNVFLLNDNLQLQRETFGQMNPDRFDCSLVSVDISCTTLSSTAIRHLATLTGPTLQHVNISWTGADTLALLYLAGYGRLAIVDLALSDSDAPQDHSLQSSLLELKDTLNQLRLGMLKRERARKGMYDGIPVKSADNDPSSDQTSGITLSTALGVTDSLSKAQGVTDSLSKAQGVTDSLSKAPVVTDSLSKAQGVTDSLSKAPGVTKSLSANNDDHEASSYTSQQEVKTASNKEYPAVIASTSSSKKHQEVTNFRSSKEYYPETVGGFSETGVYKENVSQSDDFRNINKRVNGIDLESGLQSFDVVMSESDSLINFSDERMTDNKPNVKSFMEVLEEMSDTSTDTEDSDGSVDSNSILSVLSHIPATKGLAPDVTEYPIGGSEAELQDSDETVHLIGGTDLDDLTCDVTVNVTDDSYSWTVDKPDTNQNVSCDICSNLKSNIRKHTEELGHDRQLSKMSPQSQECSQTCSLPSESSENTQISETYNLQYCDSADCEIPEDTCKVKTGSLEAKSGGIYLEKLEFDHKEDDIGTAHCFNVKTSLLMNPDSVESSPTEEMNSNRKISQKTMTNDDGVTDNSTQNPRDSDKILFSDTEISDETGVPMAVSHPSESMCSETGVTCSETGVAYSETVVTCSETEVACSETGVTFSETGVACSETGVTCSETGVAYSETGVTCSETEVVCSETGNTCSETEITHSESEDICSETGLNFSEPPAFHCTETGFSRSVSGGACSETGFTCSESAVNCSETGDTYSESAVDCSETGVTYSESAVDCSETGVTYSEFAVNCSETGVPYSDSAVNCSETGVSYSESAVKCSETGVPYSESGVSCSETGDTCSESAVNCSETGDTYSESVANCSETVVSYSESEVTSLESKGMCEKSKICSESKVTCESGVKFSGLEVTCADSRVTVSESGEKISRYEDDSSNLNVYAKGQYLSFKQLQNSGNLECDQLLNSGNLECDQLQISGNLECDQLQISGNLEYDKNAATTQSCTHEIPDRTMPGAFFDLQKPNEVLDSDESDNSQMIQTDLQVKGEKDLIASSSDRAGIVNIIADRNDDQSCIKSKNSPFCTTSMADESHATNVDYQLNAFSAPLNTSQNSPSHTVSENDSSQATRAYLDESGEYCFAASDPEQTTPINNPKNCENGEVENTSPSNMCVQFYKPNLISVDFKRIDFDNTYKYNGFKCLKIFSEENKNLQKIKISWKDHLKSSMLEELAPLWPNVNYISLIDCESLTSQSLVTLATKCTQIKTITLQGVTFIQDFAMIPFINSGCLESLNMAECRITDHTLIRMSQHKMEKMRELDLSWCDDTSSVGLDKLFGKSSDVLRKLSIRQLAANDHTLSLIASNFCFLTSINMSSVDGIGDDAVVTLVENVRTLEHVDFSWNLGVTNRSISALLKNCQRLQKAELAGLKLITSEPFLPLISDLRQWRRCQALLRFKLHERAAAAMADVGSSSDEEYTDIFMPHRSTVYGTDLAFLNLEFCDQVNDNHLAEISMVCRRESLVIYNYYGDIVKPELFIGKNRQWYSNYIPTVDEGM
ncbi:serine-rich adhesin for platelets-like [Argopecten irradians]|uniref:serine-rich adhesin for platelets-like n=1 Tax=Argopecten irradians TaxID=31199 RepID=UPI0037243B46